MILRILSFCPSRDLSFNKFSRVFLQVGGSRAQLAKGMSLHEFPAVGRLGSGGATCTAVLGVNFNDTTQTANFDLIVRSGLLEFGLICHKINHRTTCKIAYLAGQMGGGTI